MTNDILLSSTKMYLTEEGHIRFDYDYMSPQQFLDGVKEACPEYVDKALICQIIKFVINVNDQMDNGVKAIINRN